MRLKKEFFLVILISTLVTGCKKWDDSISLNNQDLSMNLAGVIAADPSLSTFSDYIKKSGVNVILESSKTFTVWAPTNAALQSLDPAIVADPTRLRAFVLNHISNQSYFTRNAQSSLRIQMLSGKYNNFLNNKFDDANVTSADKYVSNGVLHVIDKAVPVLPSVWEFINSTGTQYIQNTFIAGLNFQQFDPSLATIDSISALTGLPVYRPGTGFVAKNLFNETLSDVRREDRQFTYFLISNPGFTVKVDSLKTYFKSGSTALTDSLSKWAMVKDLIVDTLYPSAASLPPVIFSKSGTPIPIDQSKITQSIKVSNGMVYVLSTSSTAIKSKFPAQIKIEGESTSVFSRTDKRGNINYRVRQNPVTGQNFEDLMVSGHAVTGFYALYRLNEMPTMKYDVYGLAQNDFTVTAVFQGISVFYLTPPSTFTVIPVTSVQLPTNTSQFSYPVPFNTATGAYNEIYLGSFTTTLYGTLEIRLVSGGATLGSSGTGPMVLDYLRIVPIP